MLDRSVKSWPKALGMRIVRAMHTLYKLLISPLFPGTCRFEPSCSNYAVTAIEHLGMVRGFVAALRRLLRCHPWHPGGYDPVMPETTEPKR